MGAQCSCTLWSMAKCFSSLVWISSQSCRYFLVFHLSWWSCLHLDSLLFTSVLNSLPKLEKIHPPGHCDLSMMPQVIATQSWDGQVWVMVTSSAGPDHWSLCTCKQFLYARFSDDGVHCCGSFSQLGWFFFLCGKSLSVQEWKKLECTLPPIHAWLQQFIPQHSFVSGLLRSVCLVT